VIPVEALLKLPASIHRAPNGTYPRGAYEYETGSFTCEEYGYEEPVDEVEAGKVAAYWDAEVFAAQRAADIVMRMYEQRILTRLQALGVSRNVTNEWNDTANATPISDVKLARRTVRNACGVDPDTLVISYRTFEALPLVAEITDRIKYVHSGMEDTTFTQGLLARLFNVRQVLVADMPYDSADEGQTAEVTNLWSDEYALLVKVAQGSTLRQPCIGWTFLWTEDSPNILVTEEYEEPQTRSDIKRARQHVDEADVFTACAYLLGNITDAAIAAP